MSRINEIRDILWIFSNAYIPVSMRDQMEALETELAELELQQASARETV